jgi:phage major head subunit gpT-like protein
MSGIQTPAALAALKTRLFKTFGEAMASAPVFSERLGLMTDMPSDTETNTYDWLASLSGMQEWIGPRMVDGFKERVFTIRNKHYEKTVEVNRDQLDDSPMTAIGSASERLRMLVESGRKLSDDLLLDVLTNGHARTCYDGQNFFDTDHPTDLDAAGTQSNYEASGFALTGPNFATARARMMSFRGENGRPLGVRPNLLVVPPTLENTALGILQAIYGANGSSNVQAGQAKVEVVPELEAVSTTQWYLFDTQSTGAKPFIRQLRKALQLVGRTAENDEPVFTRNAYQWGVDARLGVGYGVWFKAFKGAA